MMKRLLILSALLASTTPALATHGFYAGLGGGWSSVNENFRSIISSSASRSGLDTYNANANNLTPLVQAGYWAPFATNWLWGINASWKYLGYQTPNVNGSHGQYIPDASFSSINFFGPDVTRDFSSQTNINNEVLLLFYLGMQVQQGYLYLGVGPAFFTATNNIYMWSVHVPNGVGNHLITTSASASNTVWGGAAQIGYNYFFSPSWFASFNYTYLQTANGNFNNAANAATFNGANTAGGTTLYFNRTISWSTQEVMVSINKMIA